MFQRHQLPTHIIIQQLEGPIHLFRQQHRFIIITTLPLFQPGIIRLPLTDQHRSQTVPWPLQIAITGQRLEIKIITVIIPHLLMRDWSDLRRIFQLLHRRLQILEKNSTEPTLQDLHLCRCRLLRINKQFHLHLHLTTRAIITATTDHRHRRHNQLLHQKQKETFTEE